MLAAFPGLLLVWLWRRYTNKPYKPARMGKHFEPSFSLCKTTAQHHANSTFPENRPLLLNLKPET